MAEQAISGLPSTEDLDGNEVLPLVQSSVTRKASLLALRRFLAEFGGNSVSDFVGKVIDVESTTHTITPSESGCILDCSSNNPVTIVVPATAPRGLNVGIIQSGSGLITVTTPGQIVSLEGSTTAGENSFISVFVKSNAGMSPKVLVKGDVAAATPGPAMLSPPIITGSPLEGQTLVANPGVWSGNPTGYQYQWRRNGSAIASAVNIQYTVIAADIGQSITVSVTAENIYGSATSTSAPIGPVSNGSPANVSKPQISGTIAVGSTLSASQGVWSGSPTNFTFQWNRGTTPIVGANAATFLITSADIGNTLSVTVTATNAFGSTTSTSTDTATIGGSAPVSTANPVITGTTAEGQTLSVSNGTWSNSPTSYAYQWKRDGANIGGAIGATYVLVTADATKIITCTVTATNAFGSGAATSAAVGPITAAGGAPANSALPVISGTVAVGSTLSVTNGSWTGSPSSYAYAWKRDGVAIGGATAATYVLVTGDLAAVITCTVTATNGSGSGSATSAGVGPVTSGAPANTVAPAISGSPVVGNVLTTTTGTWTGSPTYAYQWKADGVDISGATANNYTPVTGDVGKTITSTVTATNGSGSNSATSSGVGPVTASASYSSQANTLFAAMTVQPDATRKAAVDNLIVALKSGALSNSNIWAKLDLLYVFAAHDQQAATLNWKAPGTAYTATLVNAPDFIVDRGFASDGTSSYLNTGFNPQTNSVNASSNFHYFGVWSLTNVQSASGLAGSFDGTAGMYIIPRSASDYFTYRNCTNTSMYITNTDGTGYYSFTRWSNGAADGGSARNNVWQGASTVVKSYSPNVSIRVGTINGTSFNTSRVPALVYGASLSSNESTDLYNALRAYLVAVGAV